ncbi:hypothetical protein evm_010976 [Chilo suppressalis]|nr:hypothetical protein evm_010976 [Chilo suppressalis]
MAYLGKDFKFEKEENFEALITAVESVEQNPKARKILTFKPNQKLVKNGDEYTLTFTVGTFTKEIKFKSGVTFDDVIDEGVAAKSTVTVEGDTFTQVLDFGEKGSITMKREYTADTLKVTVTAAKWSGEAVRYYVVA